MRTVKYLSPTSVSTFYADRREFYLKYIAENRPPRLPQTQPMSVGSAFDAFVKNYMVFQLHGIVSPEYEFESIFEEQVEPQNRDWALEHGEYCFEAYRKSGALADLMIELRQASDEPQFELTVEGRVAHTDFVDGIPLLGKPDVFFKKGDKAKMVCDWKVNGYCSKSNTSPKKGYTICRDGWDSTLAPHSRNHMLAHKDAMMVNVDGIVINCAHQLEEVDETWANQLSVYLWLLGEPVGTQAVVGIDQLISKAPEAGQGSYPLVRVATHRTRISEKFQMELIAKIGTVWQAVQTGHIFTDLTPEGNKEMCEGLEDYYKAYETPEGYEANAKWEEWFTSTRQHRNY